MKKYVHIDDNGSIIEVVSSDVVESLYGEDVESANTAGYYEIIRSGVPYDGKNKKEGTPININGNWIQTWVDDVTSEEEYHQRLLKMSNEVRQSRDYLISNMMWRYERNARERRLGLQETDDLAKLDEYIEKLTNIPDQDGFPWAVSWPKL